MVSIRIVSVDFQKEFTSPIGKYFEPRPSVGFVKEELVPFLRKTRTSIAEIISDYRQPRPGDPGDGCCPDTEGYKSEIAQDVKLSPVWIKCMNSPIWTRKNIGISNRKPGLPYQDPKSFIKWLHTTVGDPNEVGAVVLVGLTLDCCILSTAQELKWQAYDVRILKEGTDAYSGSQREKDEMFKLPSLSNWAKPIAWAELRRELVRKA